MRGAPAGYAKLGTSAPTRALVRTEAAALAALHGGLPGVVVPELLATGELDLTFFSVGSPVPTDVRRWTEGPEATVPALRQINTLSSHRRRLADSPYAHRLRAELAAEATSVDVAPLLAAWLDELAQSPEQIEFGRMHGDWMAGNLGRLPTGLAAWDWEYSAADAPVGFDLMHWPFHMFAPWAKLVAEGISWNPKWYPDLVHVVTTRRAAQLSPASSSV